MVIKNFGLTFEQKNVLDIVRFQLMNSTYLNNYFHFFKNNLLIWPNFHHFPFNYSLIVSLRHKIFATGKCQDPIVRNLIIEKATQKWYRTTVDICFQGFLGNGFIYTEFDTLIIILFVWKSITMPKKKLLICNKMSKVNF